MCWTWLKNRFKRATETETPKPPLKSGREDIGRNGRWLERHPKGKVVNTSRGGLNMPGYQPCPQCHAGSKRQGETVGGANYWCRNHGSFFVRAL